MEERLMYQNCNVLGGGILHLHTNDKGEKFKIINMSAEKIEFKTAANVNVSEIVTLKVQIKSDLFMVNVQAVGKIIDKIDQNGDTIYTVEFIGMSDSDKVEIDQLIRSSCDLD